MSIILGIDPGSRITGFGVIKSVGTKIYYIASGCIRTETKSFPERLKKIHQGVNELITIHHPDHMAVEQVFMAKNPDSALKLGQARGAAIVAAVNYDLSIYEYSARQIKKSVVGKGSADKGQVQHMVMEILKLSSCPQIDAADALATAICHYYTFSGLERISLYQSQQ